MIKAHFQKISQQLVKEIATQIMKLLEKGSLVDMYWSLENRMTEVQINAFREGYKLGRAEVLEKIELFDSSKDPSSN